MNQVIKIRSLILKIIMAVIFYPLFLVIGTLYGIICVPIELLTDCILNPLGEDDYE